MEVLRDRDLMRALGRVLAFVLLAFGSLVCLVGQALGQEPTLDVEMTIEDAARVLGQAARVPGLELQLKDQAEEIAALQAKVKRLETIGELDEQIEARMKRRAELDVDEIEAWKRKAERLAKEKEKGRLWLTIQARGAVGALLGTPFGLPGIGIGAVAGGIAGAVEAFLSD